MTEDLDGQIREAIATLIGNAQADAMVYSWNVLNHSLADWPGKFRTDTGTHGWVIRRAAQGAEWKNGQRDRVALDYELLGFYAFRSGKAGDNSDEEFAVILAKSYNAIKASPRLEFENEVERHELLQYRQITTIKCGEEVLHFALGRLRVHLCC